MADRDDLTRMRDALTGRRGLIEKRMFGGVCFLLHDHMLCGASKRGFLFRVGQERVAEALARPGATLMEMGGRTFRGYLRVDPERCGARDLRDWVALAIGYVGALPPKAAKKKPRR